MNSLQSRIVGTVLLCVAIATVWAIVKAVQWFAREDWLWLGYVSLCFAGAIYGRPLLLKIAGVYPVDRNPPSSLPAPPAREAGRRPLILKLADSGALTNSKPLCPPRQNLNQERS